ncbi:hypothetical protein HPA12_00035 [Streptococcus suis]|nr:hypothetical protein [Streptococcus suis]
MYKLNLVSRTLPSCFTVNTDLIKYYQKELGDKVLAGRVMVIDEKVANNLLNKYEPIKEDKE